jgi:predicted nuclease of predicted toxin-antitoxin system
MKTSRRFLKILLADESVNKNLITAMRNSGYEVFSVREQMRSEKEIQIAEFSSKPPRIIITKDKDFGEIVYHEDLKVTAVILLRYFPLNYYIIKDKLLNYLAMHLHHSIGKFVVINARLTRVRFLPS